MVRLHGRRRSSRARRLWLLTLALAGAGGCTLLTDLDGLSSSGGGSTDGAAGETSSGDGGTGDGASTDVATSLDGASTDGGCKGTAGPKGIRVGAYCIDETEVTARQYADFLAAKGKDTSGQPSECAANTTFEPLANTTGEVPVRGVDWCDAFAYCKWAGKRLCGAVGTGANVTADLRANASSDEWFRACSRDGTRTYAYGSTFDPTACNLPALDAGIAQQPVRSFPKCEGGYAGIFDMVGNLWEWENSCETRGTERVCAQRGGSYASATSGPCSQSYVVPATDRSDVTIRCCSD
ncbi:MAG: SUMF1/EgtB/PvdO family nonheme iron enzyme [Deltaproteobacteria bacterium]|nr:SUMF1/EgtB/PvdO family nonheme iron enzyme [Deltaproteobacteria bacterium]